MSTELSSCLLASSTSSGPPLTELKRIGEPFSKTPQGLQAFLIESLNVAIRKLVEEIWSPRQVANRQGISCRNSEPLP